MKCEQKPSVSHLSGRVRASAAVVVEAHTDVESAGGEERPASPCRRMCAIREQYVSAASATEACACFGHCGIASPVFTEHVLAKASQIFL